MRSFILTCFLVLCLCAAASAETKIGFVDMQAVITVQIGRASCRERV